MQSSARISQSTFRLVLGLFLLSMALVPYYAMKQFKENQQIEKGASSRPPSSPSIRKSSSSSAQQHPKQDAMIQPANCQKMLKDDTIYDPNKDIEVDTKRLTITDPQFYISLHNEWL